jgi:hypothetical protein
MELESKETEVEHDIDFDDEGNVILKKKIKVKMGSKSRAEGGAFELKVRKDLEEKGWVVDKWSNNVDGGNLIPAKRRFNPFNKVMTIGTGFPDFVCFQKMKYGLYKVIGVEVKMNGNLSREEKGKCQWYLDNGIFSEIWVAGKVKEKNRVRVEYVDFGEIGKRMRV